MCIRDSAGAQAVADERQGAAGRVGRERDEEDVAVRAAVRLREAHDLSLIHISEPTRPY